MIPRTDKETIETRLNELFKALSKPNTIEELSKNLGRSRKIIYKDIGKLFRQGCKIKRNRNVWWLEK